MFMEPVRYIAWCYISSWWIEAGQNILLLTSIYAYNFIDFMIRHIWILYPCVTVYNKCLGKLTATSETIPQICCCFICINIKSLTYINVLQSSALISYFRCHVSFRYMQLAFKQATTLLPVNTDNCFLKLSHILTMVWFQRRCLAN